MCSDHLIEAKIEAAEGKEMNASKFNLNESLYLSESV